MPPKRRLKIRLIALLLLGAFGLQELSYAEPSPGRVTALQSIAIDLTTFEAPLQFSTLKDIHKGNQGTFIIHIQDAHSNLSAQRNLSSTLDALIKKYGVSLILTEGGSPLDGSLDPLKKITTPEITKRAAKSLLFEGKIAGEEYLNLTSNHPMKLRGVEDMKLYFKSVESYAVLADKRQAALEYLQQIQAAVDRLKKKLYQKELVEYEEGSRGDLSFQKKIASLAALARNDENLLKDFPAFQQLQSLQQSENKIDFNLANLEQASLITEIDKRGGGQELKTHLEQFSKMKNDRLSQYAFFKNTLNSAQEKHIDLSKYPNLLLYGEYLKAFSRIDLDQLLGEEGRLEDEVYKTVIARSPKGDEAISLYSQQPLSPNNEIASAPSGPRNDGLLLRSIDRYLALLNKAYRIQMSSHEFESFKLNEPDFSTMSYLAFINKKLVDLGYFEGLIPYQSLLEEGKKSLEVFYDSVSQRDLVFMENIEKILDSEERNPRHSESRRMTGRRIPSPSYTMGSFVAPQSGAPQDDVKPRVAILITGGYHTQHLKKLFRDKGYSYVVLTPIVSAPTNQQQYEKLLLSTIRKKVQKINLTNGEKQTNTVRFERAASRPGFVEEFALKAGARLSDQNVQKALGYFAKIRQAELEFLGGVQTDDELAQGARMAVQEDYEKRLQEFTKLRWDELPKESQEVLETFGITEGLIGAVKSYGRSVFAFKYGIPLVRELIQSKEDLQSFVADLSRMANCSGLNVHLLFKEGLPAVKRSFTPEEFKAYWPDLLQIALVNKYAFPSLCQNGLPVLKSIFTPEEFKAYWPEIFKIATVEGGSPSALFQHAFPVIRHLIQSKDDLISIAQYLVAVAKDNEKSASYLFAYGIPIVKNLIHSKDDLKIILNDLVGIAKASESWELFRFGFPLVKDIIHSREDLVTIGNDLVAIVKIVQTTGSPGGEYADGSSRTFMRDLFQYDLPVVKEFFTKEEFKSYWPYLVQMTKASGGYGHDAIDLFKSGLPTLKKWFTPQELKTYWPALLKIGIASGKNAVYLFRYGLPALKTLIRSIEDLEYVGNDLVEIAKASGEYAENVIESGLPAVKELINNREDLRQVGQELVSIAKASGNDTHSLFKFSLPAVRELIKTKEDLRLIGNDLIKIARDSSENASYLMAYGVPALKHLIKSREDLAKIGNDLIKVFGVCEGVVSQTTEALADLSALLETYPNAWDNLIKPIIYNQTQAAFLCLQAIKKLYDLKAIQSEEDLKFLKEFILTHRTQSYDLLENLLVKGIEAKAIQTPLSLEKDTINQFLSQIPYPIIEIYQAFKENPDTLPALKYRCEGIHQRILDGDTSSVEKDPFFPSLLMYVFPPAVTTEREQYLNLYNSRPDRQEDTRSIPEALQGKPFQVSTGSYTLKDPSKPLDASSWHTLLESIREVNKEEKSALTEEKINTLGQDLLGSWQEGDLYTQRKDFFTKLYRYFRSSRNQTLPEQLGSIQNIMKVKEFLGDTLRDLITQVTQSYAKTDPQTYNAVLNKMLKTKIDNRMAVSKSIAGVLERFKDNPNEVKEKIGKILKIDDPDVLDRIWNELKDKRTTNEIIPILEAITFQIQPGKESILISQILQGSDYKSMQSEVNEKYEFNEGQEKINLRFITSKRRAHGVVGLNMGVCVAPDEKLWNNPNFMNVIIFDEKGVAQGGMHALIIEDNGKRYLVLPGINPSVSLLGHANADDIYNHLIEYAQELAKVLNCEEVFIPTQAVIHSNRSEIQRVIASRNYQKVSFSKIYDFSYSPFAYQFQEGFLVSNKQALATKQITSGARAGATWEGRDEYDTYTQIPTPYGDLERLVADDTFKSHLTDLVESHASRSSKSGIEYAFQVFENLPVLTILDLWRRFGIRYQYTTKNWLSILGPVYTSYKNSSVKDQRFQPSGIIVHTHPTVSQVGAEKKILLPMGALWPSPEDVVMSPKGIVVYGTQTTGFFMNVYELDQRYSIHTEYGESSLYDVDPAREITDRVTHKTVSKIHDSTGFYKKISDIWRQSAESHLFKFYRLMKDEKGIYQPQPITYEELKRLNHQMAGDKDLIKKLRQEVLPEGARMAVENAPIQVTYNVVGALRYEANASRSEARSILPNLPFIASTNEGLIPIAGPGRSYTGYNILPDQINGTTTVQVVNPETKKVSTQIRFDRRMLRTVFSRRAASRSLRVVTSASQQQNKPQASQEMVSQAKEAMRLHKILLGQAPVTQAYRVVAVPLPRDPRIKYTIQKFYKSVEPLFESRLALVFTSPEVFKDNGSLDIQSGVIPSEFGDHYDISVIAPASEHLRQHIEGKASLIPMPENQLSKEGIETGPYIVAFLIADILAVFQASGKAQASTLLNIESFQQMLRLGLGPYRYLQLNDTEKSLLVQMMILFEKTNDQTDNFFAKVTLMRLNPIRFAQVLQGARLVAQAVGSAA